MRENCIVVLSVTMIIPHECSSSVIARSAFSIRGTRKSDVRPSVRPCVRIIITFCRRECGGGTHAAGPWWFGLWIFEGRERTLHLFGLATGISRFRDPFLNTVSGTFLQDVSKNKYRPDHAWCCTGTQNAGFWMYTDREGFHPARELPQVHTALQSVAMVRT